jgi:hypothetical protein
MMPLPRRSASGLAAARARASGAAPGLSAAQLTAIHTAMQLFVEDDVAAGVAPDARGYCDGCAAPRPAPGAIAYDRYRLCNRCATEYEVARITRVVESIGQYVRGKRFGEAEAFAELLTGEVPHLQAVPPAPPRRAQAVPSGRWVHGGRGQAGGRPQIRGRPDVRQWSSAGHQHSAGAEVGDGAGTGSTTGAGTDR